MPRPTRAHERLHVLAGDWSGVEKMHPSPWDAQGGAAEGFVKNRVALDGFAIIQDYEQRRGGRTSFTGHCVMSWEVQATRYAMHWWDSMGFSVNVFTGDFGGDRLLLACQGPTGHQRAIFDLARAANGRYSFLMEVSPDGGKWFPFMEGNYARA